MTREEIEAIFKKEGLVGWKLVITNSGSCCWYEDKQIWIDRRQLNIAMVLHEIAHALAKERKKFHTVLWADEYTKLVHKYCEIKKEMKL